MRISLAVFLCLIVANIASAARRAEVHFQASVSAQAQREFDKAVASLHSFQWAEAIRAFDQAERRDSNCAMCHWGRAVALYPALTGWPTDTDMAHARSELAEATRIGLKTARERAYVDAASAFFRVDTGLTPRDRLRAYADTLGALHRDYPDDVDAVAFYGLALIALADEEDNPPGRSAVVDLLEPEFRQHSNHPGLAHYLIHATDTPELASRGLPAARAYAALAPDSSHAVHMPSHIFVRLGLWNDVIESNRKAAAVGASAASHHHGDASYQLHAVEYLIYASLQRGDERTARELARLSHVPAAAAGLLTYHRAFFAAKIAVELHQWREAANLVAPQIPPNFLLTTYWARTIGAARLGDVVAGRKNLARLQEAAHARAVLRAHGGPVKAEDPLEFVEAGAWLAYAEGRIEEAIRMLRNAALKENADGGESTIVPANEMLADLLLDANRPTEALAMYGEALQRSPNRLNALVGAVRAARMVRDAPRARLYSLHF
jgi:tetratricopeptide (TPR) repeat protein